jgi:hypothetical protein
MHLASAHYSVISFEPNQKEGILLTFAENFKKIR